MEFIELALELLKYRGGSIMVDKDNGDPISFSPAMPLTTSENLAQIKYAIAMVVLTLDSSEESLLSVGISKDEINSVLDSLIKIQEKLDKSLIM